MAAAPEGSFAQAFGDVSGASKKQLAALEAEYRGADVRWAEKDRKSPALATREALSCRLATRSPWQRSTTPRGAG